MLGDLAERGRTMTVDGGLGHCVEDITSCCGSKFDWRELCEDAIAEYLEGESSGRSAGSINSGLSSNCFAPVRSSNGGREGAGEGGRDFSDE